METENIRTKRTREKICLIKCVSLIQSPGFDRHWLRKKKHSYTFKHYAYESAFQAYVGNIGNSLNIQQIYKISTEHMINIYSI